MHKINMHKINNAQIAASKCSNICNMYLIKKKKSLVHFLSGDLFNINSKFSY